MKYFFLSEKQKTIHAVFGKYKRLSSYISEVSFVIMISEWTLSYSVGASSVSHC